MRPCWSVFVSLITCSFATSTIDLPICCGSVEDDNGTTNYTDFTINYHTCNETLDDPRSIFKKEWKGHIVEWKDAISLECVDHFWVQERDFEIDDNGSLVLPCKGVSCCGNNNHPTTHVVNWTSNYGFCIDSWNGTLVAQLCEEETKDEPEPSLAQKISLVVSAVLLVITCAIYLAEKSVKQESYVPYLVSQSISLAAAFICLARIQFAPEILQCWECLLIGYCLQYFFLAAFFWMNAKCINVYMSMSQLRVQKGNNRMLAKMRWREFKRFSLYAWGMPLLITATTFSLQKFKIIEDPRMKPDVGSRTCFFQSGTIKWIYFYGPMAVIIVANIILFSLTATILVKHRINSISKTVRRRKDKSRLQKEIWFFNQYLKLFIVTGLSWVGEVLAVALKDYTHSWLKITWKGLDICNCLQGVFIFYFFVCQKDVLVKKLFCIPKNFKLKIFSPSEGILCCCWAEQKSSAVQSPPTTQVEIPMDSSDETSCHDDLPCLTSDRTLSNVFSRSVESVMVESVVLDDENTYMPDVVHQRFSNQLSSITL